VEAAEDPLRVDQRDVLAHLLGRQQLRRQPEGHRAPEPAVQLLPALGRRRDLDPADAVEAPELAEQLDRLLREPRHRARRVVLEHESRRVGRRAARLPQRALVDEHDVGAPQLGQVVGHAGARDAPADDHDSGRLRCLGEGVGSGHPL
jgi:hypothetical protein